MIRSSTRALAACALTALAIPAFAEARTGDPLREGVRNGTSSKETEIIGKFAPTTGAKGGYVTRQSNTGTGGAAIYGCRAARGGTQGGSAPCLRATNLADGYAFEFASRNDTPVGLFLVGDPKATSPAPPFGTNARGMVQNLNAEMVGGMTAQQLVAAGAQGAPGPKGDKGDQGDPGDRGPSNGYAIEDGFLDLGNGVSTEQPLIFSGTAAPFELDLPDDGAYIVNVSMQALVSGADLGAINCRARSIGSNDELASRTGGLGISGGILQPNHHYAMTFPYVRDAGNTGIRLTCQHSAGVGALGAVSQANVTAIRVAELDVQTP